MENRIFDSIIVGAGQSGLAMAYELKKLNRNFVLIDGDSEIGGSWLRRWDSLKLFTPTEFNHLGGMPFPAPKGHYPDKYEVAQYLKDYVAKFDLDVRLNQMVFAIEKEGNLFKVECQEEVFYANEVIMATGPFHIPFTPKFSESISKEVTQMHSKFYLNPNQLQEGPVCVVGGGDSGVQIAKELSETGSKVYLSCEQSSYAALPQEFLGKTLWWWFQKTGLLSVNVKSRLGKYLSNKMQPIIGTDLKALFKKENLIKVGKAESFKNGNMLFATGESAPIKNIVWATGYRPDFSILKFNGLIGENGYPIQDRGRTKIDGLYFVGLPWMHTRSSATLGGVKADAAFLGKTLEKRNLEKKNSGSTNLSINNEKEVVG